MITKTYAISFTGIETPLCTQISISGAEYKRQIEFLEKKLEDTKNDEYPMQKQEYVREGEQLIMTTTYFTVGTAETALIKYECKSGFYFKKQEDN